jgi:imidazole glycerol phosphate synthase subunit HisF
VSDRALIFSQRMIRQLASRFGGSCVVGTVDIAMVELLFIAQLVRNPLQAMARRWWCKSLFRATRGQRRCPECTKS